MVPPTQIDDLPSDTEQLAIEVVGDSGELISIGKTYPLEFSQLADQTSIPILMAPPNAFCAVGRMSEPRISPLVVPAGKGALVVGGTDASGKPLSTAEYYDAATADFLPVEIPASLIDAENGLAGSVLTEMLDGRVALTGTASHALAYFDPKERKLTTPILFDRRAFHGALATDTEHLLILGGCTDVALGTCAGPSLQSGFVYDLRDLARRERMPQLADAAQRLGARVLDLGVQRDGVRRFLLAGGFGDAGVADRFALEDDLTETVGGVHAQSTLLDGGSVLTAFDRDAQPPTGAAAVLVPNGGLEDVALAPAWTGARIVTLEDGSVLAFGGNVNVARYVPTTNRWFVITPAGRSPGMIVAPVLTRLADGTLLVLGGRDPSAEAWIYRPTLVGPASGSTTALPDGSTEGVLTPSDPSLVDRSTGDFSLTSVDDNYGARALVGGPRIAAGSVSASAIVQNGGVALIAQQKGPGQAVVGRLVPGESARIERLVEGTRLTLCSGVPITTADVAGAVTLTISEGVATLGTGHVGNVAAKVSCAVPTNDRGSWGIAAAGVGARVDVTAVTISRNQ